MTPEEPRRDLGAQVRRDAARQAERWGGAGLAIAGVAVVAFLMFAFIILDYTLSQDPHRVLKVALGMLAIGGILSRPRFGLLLLPVLMPFLGWIPPTPIPGLNALNLLLFGVFGVYVFGAILARRPFLRTARLRIAIGILLGLAALSVLRGGMAPTEYVYNAPFAALVLFRSAMSIAIYFITFAMARGLRDRRHIAWAVLAGLMLESLVTIRLGRTGPGLRAVGSIGQSNELGAYLAMFAVIAAAIALGARSWIEKISAAAVFVAGTIGIMLSLSRGGMLALLGGLLIVTWRSSRLAFGLYVLVLALSPFWVPDYVLDRITSSTVDSDVGDASQIDASSELRLMTWRAVLGVVEHHPLDGIGFTGLASALPNMGEALELSNVKDSAHNTYLRILAELGVFGLLAFAWLLWSVWRLADDGVRSARHRFDRSLAVGLGGAVVAMAISCAFGDRFWSPSVTGSFWVVSALVDDSVSGAAAKVSA